jgi:hypothetical protein
MFNESVATNVTISIGMTPLIMTTLKAREKPIKHSTKQKYGTQHYSRQLTCALRHRGGQNLAMPPASN